MITKIPPRKLLLLKRPPKDVEHDPLTVRVEYSTMKVQWQLVDAMITAAAASLDGRIMGAGTALYTSTRDLEYRFKDAGRATWFKLGIGTTLTARKLKLKVRIG